ncbi:MAG: MFS transporter [Alphaproteobacteria bacterium]|nr:MFS transporter [Alphaproteobacteria bacterium]
MTITPSSAGKTRWDIVVLAVLAGVFAAMEIGKVPPALGALKTEFGVGLAAVGWVASIFNALGAVLGLPAGAISDTLGNRRLIIIGLALVALGSLLGGFADSLVLALATRTLEGLGYLAILVSVTSLIVEATNPKDHSLALGIWSTFLPIGFAFMMVLAPSIMDEIGWQGLWFVNAALVSGYLVVFVLGTRDLTNLPNARGSVATLAIGQAFRVITMAGPLVLALSFVTYSLQWFGLSSWMPTFFTEVLGKSLGTAALLSALVVFMNAPGNLFGSWLLSRGYSNWSLIGAGSAIMGVLAVAIFSDGIAPDAKFWLALAFSFLGGVVPPAVFAAVPSQTPTPAHVGSVSGLVIQGNNIGFLLGTPIFGTAVEWSGHWSIAGWLILALGGAGVLVGVAFRPLEARAAAR